MTETSDDSIMCDQQDEMQSTAKADQISPCSCSTEIETLKLKIESLTSQLGETLKEVEKCRKTIEELKSDLRESMLPAFNEMQGDDVVT